MHPRRNASGDFALCFVCLQSGLAAIIQRFYVIFLVEYPGKTALVHVPALAGDVGNAWSVWDSLLTQIGAVISPVTEFFGMTWQMFMAYLSSMLTKGITAGCHQRAVQQQRCGGRRLQRQVRRRQRESGRPAARVISKAQALGFIIAIVFNVPCTMTVAATYRGELTLPSGLCCPSVLCGVLAVHQLRILPHRAADLVKVHLHFCASCGYNQRNDFYKVGVGYEQDTFHQRHAV